MLNGLLEPQQLQEWLVALTTWANVNILNLSAVWQLLALIAIAMAAYFLDRVLHPPLERWVGKLQSYTALARFSRRALHQLFSIIYLLFLWLTTGVLVQVGAYADNNIMAVVASLMSAWIIIQLSSTFIANRFIAKLVAFFAWTLAALNIVGLLGPTIDTLNAVTIPLGQASVSLLTIINGVLLLAILLWAALAFSTFIERRIRGISEITPRARVLIGKTLRFAMITVAILVALSSVGINFAALAVFTGALGVGIGIGLQKQVSNLVSGVILLLDKSIKPGDVIEVRDTFGWVREMSARYVGVVTRDNKELLIPNDDFIVNEVINWSHSDRDVRMEITFGVSYDSDPHQVREFAVEAAKRTERIIKDPAPICHLVEFGDSSLNFVLRFWIRDPEQGITNVKGKILLALWDKFKELGIEIPYPHRYVIMQDKK